jgi:hypothetical protein
MPVSDSDDPGGVIRILFTGETEHPSRRQFIVMNCTGWAGSYPNMTDFLDSCIQQIVHALAEK